jgi:hypothetical protein
MARTCIAAMVLLGMASSAFAAGPQELEPVLRHYDADAVSQGRIEVELSGDMAVVRGTSTGGPWLDVWRHATGEWTLVAELLVAEVAPIRFGAGKRRPACGRSS